MEKTLSTATASMCSRSRRSGAWAASGASAFGTTIKVRHEWAWGLQQHISGQNQALLGCCLELQPRLTLRGHRGDPLAWQQIAGWGHGDSVAGRAADCSAAVLSRHNAVCGDSVCKCPCSLGGDLAVPNLAVGDRAAPTDDSVTGKVLLSHRAALVLPSWLCRSTQGTSVIKHISSSLVGLSPSWYLQHVIVRDLQSSKSYFFLVNDWLSVESEENDGMVEKEVYAASTCSAHGCRAGLAEQHGRSHHLGE